MNANCLVDSEKYRIHFVCRLIRGGGADLIESLTCRRDVVLLTVNMHACMHTYTEYFYSCYVANQKVFL